MSRAQRLGLIALAVAAAVAAFVIARPDDENGKPEGTAGNTAPAAEPGTTNAEPTATTEPRPEVRIVLRAHKPSGGIRRIQATKGELVRIVVESDAADEVHLHGYDITRNVRPAEPARFSLRADVEGIFELESHEAEEEGGDSVIARLVVEPG